jgi:hypothetical protein
MSLTVKHLNTDASFLLTFEPEPDPLSQVSRSRPFHILVDPWITGASKIFHSRISITTHKQPACVSTLADLPVPDLVVISQHKSDHCNEATLKQLPATGTKTIILAEPNAARLLRSWKYFAQEKIQTIPKWEDPRLTGRDVVVRVPVPPVVKGGQAGEVTVAFIPQRRDISGLHAAIGITYRPPPTTLPEPPPASSVGMRVQTPLTSLLSPPGSPRSPKSYRSFSHLSSIFTGQAGSRNLPSPPTSPGLSSLRSARSFASIPFSRQSTLASASTATITNPNSHTASPHVLSVLFSPHGIAWPSLAPYAHIHLGAERALPLTCLLHCFDAVDNPWWLGGNVLSGAPAGRALARRLAARAWVSAHDGDKDVRGLATRLLKTRRWRREEIEAAAAEDDDDFGGDEEWEKENGKVRFTDIMSLDCGEEVVLGPGGVVHVEEDVHDAVWDKVSPGEAWVVGPLPPRLDVKGLGGSFGNLEEMMAVAVGA